MGSGLGFMSLEGFYLQSPWQVKSHGVLIEILRVVSVFSVFVVHSVGFTTEAQRARVNTEGN